MIDNYDSFTWNLVQYLQMLGAEVKVVRNDELSVAQIEALAPERIVISPGPCTPDEAGVSLDVMKHLGPRIPVFGVCLGHQSLGQAYGGDVVRAKTIMHGKTSRIRHEGRGVFKGLPDGYEATRYHSLVVARDTLPDCLEITAWTEVEAGEANARAGAGASGASGASGVSSMPGSRGAPAFDEIMGLRHREHPVEGVQFHPESILTEHGHALLKNFLER